MICKIVCGKLFFRKRSFAVNEQIVINNILEAHQTNELCRIFKNEIYDDLKHITEPYKCLISNYSDLFIQFFKWTYKQNDAELWSNVNYHLYKSALFFYFSDNTNSTDQSEIAIKKLLRPKYDKQFVYIKRIAEFLIIIYKEANSMNCFLGKASDWEGFWSSLTKDFVWQAFAQLNFHPVKFTTYSVEKETLEDLEDDDEYIFDELDQDYLKLTESYMPNIKNVDDLNGILWCDFDPQSDFYKTYKPNGLLDRYIALEKDRFYFRKFEENKELDNHVYYAIACDMIRSINYNDLLDNIFDLGRNILTATESEQASCIQKNKLKICKHQEKLLHFFFVKMKRLALSTLVLASKDMKLLHNCPYKSYSIIKYVIFNSNRSVRNRLKIKKIVDKII